MHPDWPVTTRALPSDQGRIRPEEHCRSRRRYDKAPTAKPRVGTFLVGRTGFEPVTFSVSGRRAPAAPTARDDESLPEPRLLCALPRLALQGRRERCPRLASEREDWTFPVLLGVPYRPR